MDLIWISHVSIESDFFLKSAGSNKSSEVELDVWCGTKKNSDLLVKLKIDVNSSLMDLKCEFKMPFLSTLRRKK